MSDQDLFLVLVASNPVLVLERSDYGDEAMLAGIIAAGKPNRMNTPRIRRGWVIGGVSVVMIVAAAFAVLRHDAPDNPTTMLCYSERSANPAQRQELPTGDPVAACREVWQSGVFGTGEVPALTACVTNDGIIAVVPGGDQACVDLGFALWRGSFDDDDQSVIDFHEELARSLTSTCYGEQNAKEVVRALLNDYGLDGWTVLSNDNWTDAFPCTASGVDAASKTVTLAGRERNSQDSNPKGP
jgi:hypothetical protein